MSEEEFLKARRYREAEGDGVWVVLPPELVKAGVTLVTMLRGQSPQVFDHDGCDNQLYLWMAENSRLMEFTVTVHATGWALAQYTWTTIARAEKDKVVPRGLWQLVDAWMEEDWQVQVQVCDYVPDLHCLTDEFDMTLDFRGLTT